MAELNASVLDAKAYLLTANAQGLSVYDHLSTVLAALLAERPANAVDMLEEISTAIKSGAFSPGPSVRAQPPLGPVVQLAKTQGALYQQEISAEESEEAPVVPNVVASSQHFEDAGVGLGREETMRIYLALIALSKSQPLKSVRFWGKIFGLEGNYVIAECEYKDGEEPQAEGEAEAPDAAAEDAPVDEDPLPKSQFVAPKPVPSEDYGSGANKKVYFVCSEPGEPWALLPHVAPHHITVARQIKKFLTGRLDAPIHSFPPFSGTEANYLRAQIACITSDTHISPIGFYTFDEEAGDDEGGRDTYIVSEEFEGKSKEELLDSSLSGWVHHTQHILPQGRCKWVNPNPPKEDEGEDEEEEEQPEAPEPETGPPLLSPLQNDPEVCGAPAWTVKLASPLMGTFTSVVASSNKWPGAHAYALGKQFDNVYIGWAQPFAADAYNPPMPPFPQPACAVDETVQETADPTREEELAFEASQKKPDEEEGGDGDDAGGDDED